MEMDYKIEFRTERKRELECYGDRNISVVRYKYISIMRPNSTLLKEDINNSNFRMNRLFRYLSS